MQIVLCVKQVFDASGPFSLTEETKSLDTSGLVKVLNPADSAALALMRRALPAGVAQITVISVGPKSAEKVLRTCLAAGADEAFRIWDDAFSENTLNGQAVARLLAEAIKKLRADLVVCGSKGLCGGSGFVGAALAEHLNLAQVYSVDHIEFLAGQNALCLNRKLEHGDREIVFCNLPALITVDSGVAEPAYAAMPAMIQAEKYEIVTLSLNDLNCEVNELRDAGNGGVLSYIPPRPRTKKSAAEKAMDPKQRMKQMLGGGKAKQSTNVIEDTPEKAAAELIRSLKANGFI